MAIQLLKQQDRDTVVAVLADAFRDYPAMQFVLSETSGPELEALVGFYTDKRFGNGWPVFGVREDNRLVAVTLVTPAGSGTTDVTSGLEERLREQIGTDAFHRMCAFESASDENEPAGRYHFVGMLGVRRSAQGRGHGRALLDRVKQLAVDDGQDGVALSTEDPANLPFYEHVGFEVVGHLSIPNAESTGPPTLDTWGLSWRSRS